MLYVSKDAIIPEHERHTHTTSRLKLYVVTQPWYIICYDECRLSDSSTKHSHGIRIH